MVEYTSILQAKPSHELPPILPPLHHHSRTWPWHHVRQAQEEHPERVPGTNRALFCEALCARSRRRGMRLLGRFGI
eukprot:1811307-Pyramimonas_sp.AAC.1